MPDTTQQISKSKSLKFKITITISVLVLVGIVAFMLNFVRLLTVMHVTNEKLSNIRLENQYCLVGCCEIPGRFSKKDISDNVIKIEELKTKDEKIEFINDYIKINNLVDSEFRSIANSCREMYPNGDLWLYPYN